MNSEADLVIRFTQGESGAFKVLFERYYPRLCAYAFQFLHDRDQSEEFVQELFTKLWERKENLLISGTFEGYIFRALKNDILNHFEHQKVQQKYIDYGLSVFDHVEHRTGYDEQHLAELNTSIANAVERMPTQRKAIFVSSRQNGMTYKEIAEKYDISVKTVENHMGAALRDLRIALADYLPHGVLGYIFLERLLGDWAQQAVIIMGTI